MPTGTISGPSPANPAYGDTVTFATSVNDADRNAQVYVTVVCLQGPRVVYQWSAEEGFAFPLADQDGDGLDWDGGPASGMAVLVHRVKHGKNVQLTNLARTTFEVS